MDLQDKPEADKCSFIVIPCGSRESKIEVLTTQRRRGDLNLKTFVIFRALSGKNEVTGNAELSVCKGASLWAPVTTTDRGRGQSPSHTH